MTCDCFVWPHIRDQIFEKYLEIDNLSDLPQNVSGAALKRCAQLCLKANTQHF